MANTIDTMGFAVFWTTTISVDRPSNAAQLRHRRLHILAGILEIPDSLQSVARTLLERVVEVARLALLPSIRDGSSKCLKVSRPLRFCLAWVCLMKVEVSFSFKVDREPECCSMSESLGDGDSELPGCRDKGWNTANASRGDRKI